MTTTQTNADRTQDRLVTQLRSALQAVREQAADKPPRLNRSPKRLFTYRQHGFEIEIHVAIVPQAKSCRRSTPEVVDTALNMAIGAADRLDEQGGFDFTPHVDGGLLSVRIVARTA